MLKLIFFAFIIALSLQFSYELPESNDTKICAIFNDYYKNQYIYAYNNEAIKREKRLTFGSASSIDRPNRPRPNYRMPPAYIHLSTSNSKRKFNEIDPIGHWILKSVPNRPNTFIIKHLELGYYLFGSSERRDSKRRYIDSSRTHNPSSKEFMWELREPFARKHQKSTNEDEKIYTIFNVYYNEPLYAAHKFLAEKFFYRPVYLWHTEPNGREFNWIIKCHN